MPSRGALFTPAGCRLTVRSVEINAGGPLHAHEQVAEQLRALVADLDDDAPLPSVSRVAQEAGLSGKTVTKAFHALRDEGLIYIISGRGSFKATHRD
jgi:GntR family transcriptional regulator